jgi:hypothetical protein
MKGAAAGWATALLHRWMGHDSPEADRCQLRVIEQATAALIDPDSTPTQAARARQCAAQQQRRWTAKPGDVTLQAGSVALPHR